MNVVILTTPTKHHTYFINQLERHCDIVGLIYERRRLNKDYPTGPFFEAEESAFEEKFFDPLFNGTSRHLSHELMKRMVEVHSVNQHGVPSLIEALAPDLVLSFGVGVIKPVIFSIPRWGTLNIHRGLTQWHRGLDSDLWAIYQKSFDQIGVTIHYVEEKLDTGPILAQERVAIEPADEIYHLRYKTTVAATRMMIDVLAQFAQAGGRLPGLPQQSLGPYFSAMPLDLKMKACEIFKEYKRETFGVHV
jgi:methionyl-tRNA formyltransferase